MATALLLLIYLAFISLGLPDTLLGASWPVMQLSLDAPLSGAGAIQMIISAGTIVSSFLSGRLVRSFGVGPVVAGSVALTAAALVGFSQSGHMALLCLLAVPLGLGGGAVDSVLNNFVANRYKARHMNWLHCFWGIGAMTGPLIMAQSIRSGNGWQTGYLTVALIQCALVVVLVASLPLWKRSSVNSVGEISPPIRPRSGGRWAVFGTPGLKAALLAYLCYMTVEATTGLWGASFLVANRGLTEDAAAMGAALFYGGITGGRFASGFISIKFGNRTLIRSGIGLCALGALLMAAPFGQVTLAGMFILGLGCAPIFPAMLHETPARFGAEASQNLMGFQMGFAYIGSTFMPPLFGLLAEEAGTGILPVFLIGAVVVMLIGSEAVNRQTQKPP